MNKFKDITYIIIMTKNHHSWGSDRELTTKAPQKGALYKFSPFDHMNAKVDALYLNIESLSNTPTTPTVSAATIVLSCELCRVNGYIANDLQIILTRGTV